MYGKYEEFNGQHGPIRELREPEHCYHSVAYGPFEAQCKLLYAYMY